MPGPSTQELLVLLGGLSRGVNIVYITLLESHQKRCVVVFDGTLELENDGTLELENDGTLGLENDGTLGMIADELKTKEGVIWQMK